MYSAMYFYYYIFGVPQPLGKHHLAAFGLAVTSVWRDAGYRMVVYIAAIQGVSSDYQEGQLI